MKKLGFAATLTLVVGNIIGVGIFTTTGFLTLYLNSPFLILLVWFVGALYALSGAYVYGILAKTYPLSGGDYQYLSREFHPIAGYFFGWSAFFITYSGSIAALAIAGAHYLSAMLNLPAIDNVYSVYSFSFISIEYSHIKTIAIILILGFSYINFRGIILSGKYQIVLTFIVFFLLILFTLAGLLSVRSDYSLLAANPVNVSTLSGVLIALIAVLFSYSGWTTAVYVAEEVNLPSNTIPRALRWGVLLVGGLYLMINVVYLISVPLDQMKGVVNIASVVFTKLWGSGGGILISTIILVAICSSLNSTILSGPRIYQVMGREGLFFGITKEMHFKYNSPHKAILLQMIWSVILVLSGGFNQLLSFVVFVITVFSLIASVISLRLVLRQREFSVINLAIITFYGLFCLIIMINTLIAKPVESLLGVILLLPALPLYYFERHRAEL